MCSMSTKLLISIEVKSFCTVNAKGLPSRDTCRVSDKSNLVPDVHTGRSTFPALLRIHLTGSSAWIQFYKLELYNHTTSYRFSHSTHN